MYQPMRIDRRRFVIGSAAVGGFALGLKLPGEPELGSSSIQRAGSKCVGCYPTG